MALREIGAKLTLEGEQAWNQQMKAADRELANLKSELAATSAEFTGQANTIDALRAKQQLQAQQTQQQKEKVRALAEAVADATEKWGEESTQVDKLTQKYNYARASLANMETNLQETTDYLEEAESAADGCATSIDGYGKKVKAAASPTGETADKVQDLSEAEEEASGGASSLLGALQKMVPGLNAAKIASNLTAAGIASGLAEGFKKAWDWAMNLIDSTAELRGELRGLEVSVHAAGLTMDDEMNEAMKTAFASTGDMSAAIETVSHLLNAKYSSSGMADILDQLSGAVVAFPSASLDSLAESLQKTLATGDADGQFKDMLERLGVDVENFTAALDDCSTAAEAQNLVLQTLADSGLSEMTAEYRNASEASIALSEAQYDLEMANARLAASLEPAKTAYLEVQASFANDLAQTIRLNHLMGDMEAAMNLQKNMAGHGVELSIDELLTFMEQSGQSFLALQSQAQETGQSWGEIMANAYNEATEAAEALAAQEQAAADAADAEAAAHEAAMEALATTSENVDTAMSKLAELQETYDNIRSGLDNVVTGFENLTGATDSYTTSVPDMIAALESQLDYMSTYEENLQTAKDMGLSDALIEEFSDAAVESAAYLQAIVDDGGVHIEDLNAKFSEVSEGKDTFVETVAEALPGITETLDEITASLDSAVADWNMYGDANASANMTMQGYIDGISARLGELQSLGAQVSDALHSGYTGADQQASPSKRSRREMGYTLQGYEAAAREMLPSISDVGAAISDSFHDAWQIAAPSRAMDIAQTGGAESSAGDGSAGEIVGLLRQHLPTLEKLANMQIIFDTGSMAGALAPAMDSDLGERQEFAGRGHAQ